jgi:hypothetical protein
MIQLLAAEFTSEFTPSSEYLQSLPEIIHKYGEPKPEFLGSRWVTYAAQPDRYRLSFLGSVVESMPEFASDVLGYLGGLLGEAPDPDGLALMRTIGSVPLHQDETRLCAINIGLYNTESAITSCYDATGMIVEQVRCTNGSVYLLNTAAVHSVCSETFTPRFLISYALYQPFDVIATQWHKARQSN